MCKREQFFHYILALHHLTLPYLKLNDDTLLISVGKLSFWLPDLALPETQTRVGESKLGSKVQQHHGAGGVKGPAQGPIDGTILLRPDSNQQPPQS